MSFTVYDATFPVYKQGLKTLNHLLGRLEEHSKVNRIPEADMLDARLAENMFDFKRQVQIACDHAKGAAMRLSGQEVPAHPDTETTVNELRERIRKVQNIVDNVKPDQLKGVEDRNIKMVFHWGTLEYSGADFVTKWSLPNFFFHLTTAYNILRNQGVQIGKKDFLGE